MLAVCLFAFPVVGRAGAAEFDINGPTVELRRVQFCLTCKKALLVTTVPPGARIQCPGCDTVQPRLPTRHLLTNVYQVCPRCGARMDVKRFKPGQWIRCGTCGHVQRVLRQAVLQEGREEGTGWLPDLREVPAEILPPQDDGPSSAGASYPSGGGDLSALRGPELAEEPATASLPQNDMALAPELAPVPGLPPAFKPRAKAEEPVQVALAEEGLEPISAPRPADYGDGPDTALPPVAASEEAGSLRVVARVNGQPIHAADLEVAVEAALARARLDLGRRAFTRQGRALLEKKKPEFRRKALEMLINRTLLFQEAEAAGIRVPADEVVARADGLGRQGRHAGDEALRLQEARYARTLEKLAERRPEAGLHPTPDEIRRYYETHRREFLQPCRVGVRGLVVFLDRTGRDDTRSAQRIVREVVTALEGGASFRDLVYKYSEDPSARRGGVVQVADEPLVPLTLLASPVAGALGEAAPGKVLGPVLLPGCIALVLPEVIRPSAVRPLGEVSAEIRKALVRRNRRQAIDRWVAELRAEADIRIP